jgi:hypothetical protein
MASRVGVAVHRDRTDSGDGGDARSPRAGVEDRQFAKHVGRASWPFGDRLPILTLPEMMMYSRSPGSPWANTMCPRGKSAGCSCLVNADTALGSTPWKIPALLRISSTGGPTSC